MSHLVIHIGSHKTGSTTIQDSFWHNSKRLKKFGITYPQLKYPHTGHHGLIADLVGLPQPYHLNSGGKKALQSLCRHYAQCDGTLFLSSEEFSRAEEERSVDFQFLSELGKEFKSVRILCFLRPQWRFIQSIYLEISRTRSPPRPPDLVAEAVDTGRCQGLYMNYLDLLDRLETSFSPDQIEFIDFEAARLKEGGILDAALRITNSTARSRQLRRIGAGHSNRSPDALPQWAANLLCEPQGAPDNLVETLKDSLGNSRQSVLLTRDEIHFVNQAFKQSNSEFVSRRKKVQPDFSLSDPKLDEQCMFREDVQIEHWLRIGRALVNDPGEKHFA